MTSMVHSIMGYACAAMPCRYHSERTHDTLHSISGHNKQRQIISAPCWESLELVLVIMWSLDVRTCSAALWQEQLSTAVIARHMAMYQTVVLCLDLLHKPLVDRLICQQQMLLGKHIAWIRQTDWCWCTCPLTSGNKYPAWSLPKFSFLATFNTAAGGNGQQVLWSEPFVSCVFTA